ncbi:formyltransferase family protein [bacterium]|nr:formyltransferase family protein [bacterium]
MKLGLSCMQTIYQSGNKLALAVTLEDNIGVKKSGRVYIDDFCVLHNIPLEKCKNINDEIIIQFISEQNLDWLFIIGWSQIAHSELLKLPKLGVLGIHPTLLPIGRGRAAIPWAILKGLDETGVTLFKLDNGVDTGPIVLQQKIPLSDSTTATELYKLVNRAHIDLIKIAMPLITLNNVTMTIQDEKKASVWGERTPEDGIIDLQESIYNVERLIRSLTKPYPGAYIKSNGKKVIIWKAQIKLHQPQENEKYIRFKDGWLILLKYEEIQNI